MTTWTNEKLAEQVRFVRLWSDTIDRGAEATVKQAAVAFEAAGFVRGQHVGLKDESAWDPQTTLEWYAGQLMDIAAKEAWFAVNSWVNCADKFAPIPITPPSEERT